MQIPSKFKELQKKTFQDKTVYYRPATEEIGTLGSVTTVAGSTAASFLVNIQPVNDAVKAKEWGLELAHDAIMTSSEPLPIEHNNFIQYGTVVYEIVTILHYDSHDQILLKMTEQKAI